MSNPTDKTLRIPEGFTPGPWRVHRHDHIHGDLWLSIGHHTHEGTSDPEGRWIGPVAEIKYVVTPEAEQEANAALIALAPDMAARIERLEKALRECEARFSTLEANDDPTASNPYQRHALLAARIALEGK